MPHEDASDAAPLAEGTFGLLASERNIKYGFSAETAMHKSLLVLVGLAAFWLALGTIMPASSNYSQSKRRSTLFKRKF